MSHLDINWNLIDEIRFAGGHAMLAGGAVRDYVLGVETNDWDIEVYDLQPDELRAVLEQFGLVRAVGASYGVYKVRIDGQDYDFSVPRRDNKTGRGHKGFMPEVDPHMTFGEACARRHFTIGSMLLDLHSGELIDIYHGRRDLNARILRVTSDKFGEDPLRVLIGMQLAGRFELTVEPATAIICSRLTGEYDTLSQERIWGEWYKWASKSVCPSFGLRALQSTGWVWLYDELGELRWCDQNPTWHPEGDVWSHTLLTVDAAAMIAMQEDLEPEDKAVLIFAALCHDMGKPEATQGEGFNITHHGHAKLGAEVTERFLTSIGALPRIIQRVVPLVREHMVLSSSGVTPRMVRRLADRLWPATITELAWLIEADNRGRMQPGMPFLARQMVREAERQEIAARAPKPILMGRHLIQLGLKPGPHFRPILDRAFVAQLDGKFSSIPGAIAWAKQEVRG
jgi:tRNA nucleotidyltransferase (CCA-adding enzyme)